MQITPKKSLGQHFLHSKKVLSEILTGANIRKDEIVLEIGPGTGILTQELLNNAIKVIAVEKDTRSCKLLKEKFAHECENGRLILICDDILKSDCSALVLKNGEYALVANIPYYITGAILEKFLANSPRPGRMVLLVQKEVAERIVAKDSKESILSISVKVFGNPRIIAKVPRGAFVPAPSVDSAILSIDSISDKIFIENNIEISHFFDIVRSGFAHKRKFLIRNLEAVCQITKLRKIWNEIGLNDKARAEDLSLKQWIEIAKNS